MIHRTKDLSSDEKAVLEGLLGRSMSEDECISIRTAEAPYAPEWLQSSWASARESGVDRLSMEEIDAEIAAVRDQRYGRMASKE